MTKMIAADDGHLLRGTRAKQLTDRQIAVRHFLYVIFKHKRKVSLIFGSIVLIVVIASFLIPPTYQSSATILIKVGRENIYIPAIAGNSGTPIVVDGSQREEQINSEIELIKGHNLIEEVIRKMGANTLYPPLLGFTKPLSLEKAVQRFHNALSVMGVKRSNIIKVKFEHRDPSMAAKALNTLLDVFIQQHVAAHQPTRSHDFFAHQAKLSAQALSTAEQELEAFRGKHNLVAIEIQKAELLKRVNELGAEANSTNAQISEHRGKKEALQARGTQQAEASRFGKETDLNVEVINTLRSKVAQLKLKEVELLNKYNLENRLVTDIRREVREAEDLLAREEQTYHSKEITSTNYIVESLEKKAGTQRRQLAELQRELNRIGNLERQHKSLVRMATLAEESHQLHVRKMEEGRISNDMDMHKMANVSVIEPASPPVIPYWPKKSLNFLISVLLGGIISIGAALFYEAALIRTLGSSVDIEKHLGIPVLGALPDARALLEVK